VSRDIDTLIEFALVGAREEAAALQRFLLTTDMAEYVEANPFLGHTESGPELTRRDYFQTLTFFRELLGIEGAVGSEAYFLAESRLARLARLLAIAEEDQGEPFIERVADRELRYREMMKDFEKRAGKGGAWIDPPARAVFRES